MKTLQEVDFFFEPGKALENLDITLADLNLTKDGWLFIHIAWSGPYETRYYELSHCSIESGKESITIEFNVPAPNKYETWFEIGLCSKHSEHLQYSYRFYEWFKYGINVYFAPPKALELDSVLIIHKDSHE